MSSPKVCGPARGLTCCRATDAAPYIGACCTTLLSALQLSSCSPSIYRESPLLADCRQSYAKRHRPLQFDHSRRLLAHRCCLLATLGNVRSLGVYPAVSLAQARKRRDTARELLTSIKPRDILALSRRMETRGAVESSHRVKQVCGQICRFCVALDVVERDVTADLRGALKAAPRQNYAALTGPKDVAVLMRAIHGYKGSTPHFSFPHNAHSQWDGCYVASAQNAKQLQPSAPQNPE